MFWSPLPFKRHKCHDSFFRFTGELRLAGSSNASISPNKAVFGRLCKENGGSYHREAKTSKIALFLACRVDFCKCESDVGKRGLIGARFKAGLASNRELFRGVGSSIHFRYVGSFKQVVYGDIEVVGNLDQFVDPRFPVTGLIAADRVLISIQVNGESYLGDTP